jgi:hypothetical protein
MWRWLVWFAIGAGLLFWPWENAGLHYPQAPIDSFHAFVAAAWFVVTAIAVTIAIIRWLLRSRVRA